MWVNMSVIIFRLKWQLFVNAAYMYICIGLNVFTRIHTCIYMYLEGFHVQPTKLAYPSLAHKLDWIIAA